MEWGQVVLLNDGIVALHRDGTVSRLFHTMTALYGDQDLAEWDEVVREYDTRQSRETIRRACVHLPDGTTRKSKTTIAQLDAHVRAIHLTFFPLRPGIVLELEEQFDRFTPFELGPGVWSQLFLQGPAPRLRTRVTFAIAKPFTAQWKVHHCDWQPVESQQGDYHVWQWDLRDLPGIELDAWSPPPRDFVPWIDLTTLPSWQPVARYFVNELIPKSPPPAALVEQTSHVTKDAQTARDKVADIYKYATRDVRYGRSPREVELETPRHASQMLEDLRGDCKDKSALMVSMLRQLGIRADIALIQSRSAGVAPSLPAPWFDHALVRVELDGSQLWLDPAGGPYTFGDVPYNDQGTSALILDGSLTATRCLIPETTPAQHKLSRICRGRLTVDGSYQYSATATTNGELAVVLRLQYLHRSADNRARMLARDVAAEVPGADVHSASFQQLEDLLQEVIFQYELTLRSWARRVKDLLLFRVPWAVPVPSAGLSETERLTPMAAPGVGRRFERHEIGLPPGFEAYGLPFAANEECDHGRYRCMARVEDSTLICERESDFFGGVVPPENYKSFKRFWDACTRSDATDIVLIKAS